MGGRSSRIRIGLSIRFSRWQPQPPGRLKDRCVVNPSAAAPRPLLIVAKSLTPHWRTFRRREHLSGYRSRQARVGATEAVRSWLETNEKQAINRQFGTISGRIGPFSNQIAQIRTAILTRSASCARSKVDTFECRPSRQWVSYRRGIDLGWRPIESSRSRRSGHRPSSYSVARVGTRRRCPIRIVVLRPRLLADWIARTLAPYFLARPRRVSPRDTLWVT